MADRRLSKLLQKLGRAVGEAGGGGTQLSSWLARKRGPAPALLQAHLATTIVAPTFALTQLHTPPPPTNPCPFAAYILPCDFAESSHPVARPGTPHHRSCLPRPCPGDRASIQYRSTKPGPYLGVNAFPGACGIGEHNEQRGLSGPRH